MKNQNKKSRQSSNSLKELLRLGPLRREIEAPQGFRCFFPIRLALRAHPSRPLEQLMKNEVADHVMDDACAFATIYLWRSEEHTSELQSLMRISYAVFCLKNTTHKLQK